MSYKKKLEMTLITKSLQRPENHLDRFAVKVTVSTFVVLEFSLLVYMPGCSDFGEDLTYISTHYKRTSGNHISVFEIFQHHFLKTLLWFLLFMYVCRTFLENSRPHLSEKLVSMKSRVQSKAHTIQANQIPSQTHLLFLKQKSLLQWLNQVSG